MEIEEIAFPEHLTDSFFRPIRSKIDQILILLDFMKYTSIYNGEEVKNKGGIVKRISGKRSRLVFENDDKIFTIAFPFRVLNREYVKEFETMKGDLQIDNQMISHAISYFKKQKETVDFEMWDEISEFDSIEKNADNYFKFCKFLMICEHGYLRMDHDEKNKNEDIHPLDHLDVYIEQSASFKIGLLKKMNSSDLIDILNPDTDCFFLNKKKDGKIGKLLQKIKIK